MGDEGAGAALDGIGAGLAETVAGGDVGGDAAGREFFEADVGNAGRLQLAAGADQPDAGDDAVRAARQFRQHARGVFGVGGFAEHLVVQHHFGVGAQHHRARVRDHRQQAGAGLLAGDAADVGFRRFAGQALFGNVHVQQAEGQAELAQQVAATGRLRGEIEHRPSIAVAAESRHPGRARAAVGSGPVVGMVGQQAGGAVELFGQHQAHQHVRQGQRPERPAFLRGGDHFRRVAFGAADQEGQVAALLAPVFQAHGQLFGAVGLAAAVEADHVRIARHRGQHPGAFVGHGAGGVAALAAQARRDFDQLQRKPVRKTLLVLGKPGGDPVGRAFADGDQPRLHSSGGWSPTVQRRSSA